MPKLFENPTQVTELARKHWPTFYGLLLAEVFAFVATGLIIYITNPDPWVRVVMLAVAAGITFFIWRQTNRLPKTKKGRIGFVISISTADEDERRKIMEDFVTTLHGLLKAGASGQLFQLIRLPEHVAMKIVDEGGG